MGQKEHPFGLRLGYNKTWKSRWYAKKDYGVLLHEDLRLKKELKNITLMVILLDYIVV